MTVISTCIPNTIIIIAINIIMRGPRDVGGTHMPGNEEALPARAFQYSSRPVAWKDMMLSNSESPPHPQPTPHPAHQRPIRPTRPP